MVVHYASHLPMPNPQEGNLGVVVVVVAMSHSFTLHSVVEFAAFGPQTKTADSPAWTPFLTRNQPHNTFIAPLQYWLGITKPKSAFSTS